MVTELPGAVGGVAQHLGPIGLVVDEATGGIGIGGVAGGEVAVGDQSRLEGLGGRMGFEAVAVGVRSLVGMAGLGIDGGDDPVGAVRWAMRHRPGPSPGSTSWPATRAAGPQASACSSVSSRPRSSTTSTSSLGTVALFDTRVASRP